MNIVAITALLWMGWVTSSLAASFDCAKENTKVEHIICDNPDISNLDEALAQSYKDALQNASKANAIKQAQKQWLKQRNGCGDADCVRRTYDQRLLLLRDTTNGAQVKIADGAKADNSRARYVLMMSEDDAVCKPILAEYNRNILLDLPKLMTPHPYPWPAPFKLAVIWKEKPSNKSLPENERSLLERMYSYIEVDVDGNGQTEAIIRQATWLRGDDRFSDLDIFPHGMEFSDQKEQYELQVKRQAIKVMGGAGGDYSFPKMKKKAIPGTLNDFDVIQFNGKYYVTGKTVEMDGIVEMHGAPQRRVISRVRLVKPEVSPELDLILDSVCYLELKNNK